MTVAELAPLVAAVLDTDAAEARALSLLTTARQNYHAAEIASCEARDALEQALHPAGYDAVDVAVNGRVYRLTGYDGLNMDDITPEATR